MASEFEFDTVHEEVLWRLEDQGIYTYHQAATGSRYLKFPDPRMGSIRIADHIGRRKYNYRWNVWVGGTHLPRERVRRGIVTYHFDETELVDLEEAVRRFKRRLLLGIRGEGATVTPPEGR